MSVRIFILCAWKTNYLFFLFLTLRWHVKKYKGLCTFSYGVGVSCSTNSHHYTTLVYIHVHNSCFMTLKSENQLNMENSTAMFGLNPAVEDITTSHIQQVFRSDIPTLYSTVMWPSSYHMLERTLRRQLSDQYTIQLLWFLLSSLKWSKTFEIIICFWPLHI